MSAIAMVPPLPYEPLNLDELRGRCRQKIGSFNALGQVRVFTEGQGEAQTTTQYTFIDNGASILAVAHLDTVSRDKWFDVVELAQGPTLFCRQLDDRLGVHLLLDHLPRLLAGSGFDQLPYDVLLTIGEEQGQSSARFFTPPAGKHYQWIFECDRAGEDVVGYQYQWHPGWEPIVQEMGLKPGLGSYTDIAHLVHLGVLGFNFGVGYELAHHQYANANLNTAAACASRIAAFIMRYAQTPMPFFTDPAARVAMNRLFFSRRY